MFVEVHPEPETKEYTDQEIDALCSCPHGYTQCNWGRNDGSCIDHLRRQILDMGYSLDSLSFLMTEDMMGHFGCIVTVLGGPGRIDYISREVHDMRQPTSVCAIRTLVTRMSLCTQTRTPAEPNDGDFDPNDVPTCIIMDVLDIYDWERGDFPPGEVMSGNPITDEVRDAHLLHTSPLIRTAGDGYYDLGSAWEEVEIDDDADSIWVPGALRE